MKREEDMYGQVLDNLRKAYDRNAAEREGYSIEDWKVKERDRFLSLLLEAHKHKLLEIGAGPGHYSKFFQNAGLEVVCTDLSPQMVRLCQAKRLEAYVMDFLSLDFPPASFDAVFALNCLLHVPKKDLPRVLDAIRGVLKPSGVMYFGVWGGNEFEGIKSDDWCEPKRFFSFYTDDNLRVIVSKSFELISFDRIAIPKENYHFQSMILKKA
jgi:SAM-dependent methyltransferase